MIDIKIHNRGLEFDIINYFDFLYIYGQKLVWCSCFPIQKYSIQIKKINLFVDNEQKEEKKELLKERVH